MKYLLIPLILISTGCATTIHPQCGLPGSETLTSIVRIATDDGSNASGVVVDQDRVLTVAHAVGDGSTAMVKYREKSYKADVIATDTKTDLALLAVETGDLEPVRLSTTQLKVFEQVWAVGFPLALEQKMTLGLFQNDHEGRLYTSTHINSGSSGGGLIRCRGGIYELAGVVHGYVAYRDGDNYVNIGDSTSVPAKQILAFMDGAARRPSENREPNAGKPILARFSDHFR